MAGRNIGAKWQLMETSQLECTKLMEGAFTSLGRFFFPLVNKGGVYHP